MKRKICVITGTRADYGHLLPVMKAISQATGLTLQVVATGMHLMKEFGYTVKEIEKDGFRISAKVNASYKEDSGQAIAVSVGKTVIGLTKAFCDLQPDVVVVLGDRGEMLAAAIAANYLNIPVAHLHGGELSGHVDGIVRHAVTKLAHLHFPATNAAGQRIVMMGEEPWRVRVVGAPTLDKILNEKLPTEKILREKYGLGSRERFLIAVQHPVSREETMAGKQMAITLEAIARVGMRTLLIYPNADAGGRAMIKVIKRYESQPFIITRKSIPHKDYLGLMRLAAVLIGNSSSGIIEAPSFRLPAVNIGSRQSGRERSANVLDVQSEEKAIIRAIKKALSDKKFLGQVRRGKNIYGDGRAVERIVQVLRSITPNNNLLQKKMTY